jgi:SAM-dependent methyltransferase
MSVLSAIRRRIKPTPAFAPTSDYLSAYRRHTDERVKRNPKEAVGGLWEEIGQLQIDFLKGEGLKPSSALLDIGCGTLRGGRHFIRYLDARRYTGTEMSAECVKAARQLVADEGLTGKRPTIVHVPDGNFRFDGLPRFDFIFAQSVFTHLHEPLIEECFANIAGVMEPRSRFYFTFNEADGEGRVNITAKDFAYPLSYFQRIGRENGLSVENASDRYPHPRNQKMALATLQPTSG